MDSEHQSLAAVSVPERQEVGVGTRCLSKEGGQKDHLSTKQSGAMWWNIQTGTTLIFGHLSCTPAPSTHWIPEGWAWRMRKAWANQCPHGVQLLCVVEGYVRRGCRGVRNPADPGAKLSGQDCGSAAHQLGDLQPNLQFLCLSFLIYKMMRVLLSVSEIVRRIEWVGMSAMLRRAPGIYIHKLSEAILWPCEFQHMAEKKHKLQWLRKVHLQRTECVDH